MAALASAIGSRSPWSACRAWEASGNGEGSRGGSSTMPPRPGAYGSARREARKSAGGVPKAIPTARRRRRAQAARARGSPEAAPPSNRRSPRVPSPRRSPRTRDRSPPWRPSPIDPGRSDAGEVVWPRPLKTFPRRVPSGRGFVLGSSPAKQSDFRQAQPIMQLTRHRRFQADSCDFARSFPPCPRSRLSNLPRRPAHSYNSSSHRPILPGT